MSNYASDTSQLLFNIYVNSVMCCTLIKTFLMEDTVNKLYKLVKRNEPGKEVQVSHIRFIVFINTIVVCTLPIINTLAVLNFLSKSFTSK